MEDAWLKKPKMKASSEAIQSMLSALPVHLQHQLMSIKTVAFSTAYSDIIVAAAGLSTAHLKTKTSTAKILNTNVQAAAVFLRTIPLAKLEIRNNFKYF